MRMCHHQCQNKVVKEGYCRVHHPDAVKARREEASRKYRDKIAQSPINRLTVRNEDLERRLAECREALVQIRTTLGDFKEPWNLREIAINALAHEALTNTGR